MILTKPQMSIYEMEKFVGGSISNVCGSMFVKTDKSANELCYAVNELYRLNDALRIRIYEDDGQLYQIVEEYKKKVVEIIRFDTDKSFEDYASLYAKVPLDIYGCLAEIKIIVLPDKVGIIAKLHHIISDAWTLSLLCSQFNKLLNNEEVQTYSYIDYVTNEEKYLKSPRYIKDKEYFVSKFQKCEPEPKISEVKAYNFKSKRNSFFIDKERFAKIVSFAKDKDFSEFVLFLSAAAMCINRMNMNSERFWIGTSVLNRSGTKEQNTMGMFVNTAPAFIELDNEKSFVGNLIEINASVLSVLRHQKYNYSSLLQELKNNYNFSGNLYDVIVNYQNAKIVGDKFKTIWHHNGMQLESLQINIDSRDSDNYLQLNYDYRIDKFTENEIIDFHNHLCNLLFDAIECPDKKISELSMLSAAEKKKILVDFNDTHQPFDEETCVYKLFEEQAESTPDKTAVVFNDKHFTYSGLCAMAEEYAGKLVALGTKPQDTVAVHLERSHRLIVLQLAVLKIGAIFLPIDKRYPEERISLACSDCDVKLLITDENVNVNTEVIGIDEFENISAEKTQTVVNKNSCYIIYTSGSTGKPKGCLLNGRGLLNFCKNNNTLETLNKIDDCIFACVNAVSFDYFIAESLLPLTNGFTTVVLDESESTIQQKFLAVAEKNNINVIMTTPTRLKIYFDGKCDTSCLAQLKCICTSGEPLTPELLSTMYKKSPEAKVYNPIGPSECSVWDMGGELLREDGTDIHIGKPIANAQIYITDKYLNPVPIGVTGEICIAGYGVGNGYVNNPELTNEKFTDNPFGDGKLYKTGDLAYWREDGNIVFVGRNDFQVKIRGLRMELGEIENAISDIDGISMAVAVVRKDSEDRQLICAFYTGEEKSTKELRDELSVSLPKYMIPHIFTHISEMPLTSSGKINRKDLPEINLEGITTKTEYAAPATDKEIALAEVIKAVLRTENVNMLDNFFDVGGDSIKAIHMVSALEEKGYGIHVADIMQKETFADIASTMNEISDGVVYEQSEINGFVPFTPIMRAYLNSNDVISSDFYHTCIFVADCDEYVAKKAIDALCSHHDMLRGRFCDGGIKILPSAEKDFYSFGSIHIDDKNEATEYLKDTKLTDDKCINVVFCSTAKENLISVTVHHFLIDLVSWEILLKDFQTAVEQLKNEIQVSLPAKTASFKLWNEMLENYSERMPEASIEYWQNVNEKLKNTKSFRLNEETVNEAERYNCKFDKDISDKLINDVKKIYNTRPNEVILVALGLAACKIAGGSAGIIVESHGRTALDEEVSVDRTVGWFTSCYPVVFDGEKDINQTIISTKEELRRIPENGISYLMHSHGLSENADILFNFYETDLTDSENGNKLVAFKGGSVAFSDKISVDCFIANGILEVNIVVPESVHKKEICKELGVEFSGQLMKIIDLCTHNHTAVRTPSDFSDSELTQNELSDLNDLFKCAGETIADIYSVTPTQEGMFAQCFRNNTEKTYHIQNTSRISKDVDLSLLEKSVELLSLRHPVLKAAFTVTKSTGEIKQVIPEKRKPGFTILLINDLFSEEDLNKIVDREKKKTFDLQRDVLFRVTVADFKDERFMIVNAHHIILDGWCLPVIIEDLQRYYAELSAGLSAEEVAAAIRKEASMVTSYAEYVSWIRNQDKTDASEYWRRLLADNSISNIFGKEKKDNERNKNIVTFRTQLSKELTSSIEQFAKESRVSHNTVFEGAFSVALHKYSGNDDVVYDKVISGRSIPLKNIKKTVGPFINTVPSRIRIGTESTFADLFKEIQLQTVEANDKGILPLAEIYRACDMDSRNIDALFVFENYFTGDISEIQNGPFSFEVVSFDEQTEFGLTVTIMKDYDGYTIRTSYASEMYTESEIKDFVRGYISVLESSLDQAIFIKDVSAADMTMINGCNETDFIYDASSNATLYTLFEKIAKVNTEKVCIKTSERTLAFGELCCISENLDTEIRKITDSKKSVIAVIAERSCEMYSAIYGIIRGGNAYLPIDPEYPQDRIEYILENSNAAAVVCQRKFAHLAGNIPCINMTEFLDKTCDAENVIPAAAEENDTAYVIYTSGSTGNPKGARVSHKSAVNRILWMHDKYPLGENDVILQKTPYTFDVSVWEHFWWGIAGGSLAVSKPGEHFLPAKILDEVHDNNVTHLHFVPSVFELFLNYLEAHTDEVYKFNTVKHVFLSGEALSASLIQRFYRLYDYGKVSLHNLYGPTECAVDVTYYDCSPEDCDPVPIGKPIYNTQIHIVDKYMNLVPVGVQGELCIAGMNVGQGYLNNPELTNEKFTDNPFGDGKLYKTGDLAYWREDGNIIFVGRMDGQIKLNGQRIEIGEIEAVINGCEGVNSVGVVVRKVTDNQTLVAFYSGNKDSESAIRRQCEIRLPGYMIPGIFVHVDNLPLNNSGKLDRRKLTELKLNIVKTIEYALPVNDTEKFICGAFSTVLGVDDVGRNSDFFELGGSSLDMISILSQDGFEGVSAAEFMRNPTPAMLARVLRNKNNVGFEYLEPLYISDKNETAIILLPFAGGGAEAYSGFVKELKNRNDEISVYFIRYLHSANECRRAADEIVQALYGKDVLFYSHCVGSAIALNIINCLEKQDFPVKRYFSGASIPPRKFVKKNIWNIVPDFMLKSILVKAGADIVALNDEKLRRMLISFRHDTDFANVSYADFGEKIKTPINVIISKEDIFTKNYRKAQLLWEKYADNVDQIYYIDSNSHYFQSESSSGLAAYIDNNIR